jgi:FkbM family methyltransferase
MNIQDLTNRYLNFDNGVFIEVGAVDGIHQSNTNYLEKHRNWTGVLIEPNTEAYKKCVTNRDKSKVFNCALVDYNYAESEIEMHFRSWIPGDSGPVTSVFDSPFNKVPGWDAYNNSYMIPARTLDSVLQEANVEKIDFFSLDVEGYELKVLQGFDFKKYKPSFILVEAHDAIGQIEEIEKLLSDFYYVVEKPTSYDYLFKYKD